MTASIETMVDAHLAACCEPDPAQRMAAFAGIWNAHGRLVDPPLESTGHSGISAQAAVLQQQFPQHRFRRTTPVDQHHGFARYGWALQDRQGAEVLRGTDFLALDVDGRILTVVGFFGEQPTAG